MATIMDTLFGVSAERYQQERDAAAEAQALQFARLSPTDKASYGVQRGAYGLAGALGGLLGGTDPELQRRTQAQQILGMINPSKPETFDMAAQMAADRGDQQLAFGLRIEGDKYKQQKLIRDDEAAKRLREQTALDQQTAAQKIAQSAYQPGTAAQTIPESVVVDQAADTSYLEPQRVVPAVAPSYDISRVAPQLQAMGAPGYAALEAAGKAARPEYKEAGGVLYEIPKFGGGGPRPVTQTARKTITIGNRVLDANTMDVLFTAPDATPAAVAEWKAFQALPKNEQQSFLQLQAAKRPSTTINMPNEGERKAATLANRLNFSVDQINQAIGVDPTAAMPNTSVEIARFLSRSEMIPNKFTSAQRQIVESAQLDILDAALTLGTGAAYTREQLEGYRKSYFPQINDKPENVVAKRARLQNILRSAEIASGRAKVPTPIPSMGADLSSVINAPPSN